MSPRNLDDADCKDNLPPGGSQENYDFKQNILHKKHKVIKLVKDQLLNLQEQGLLESINRPGKESVKFRDPDSELRKIYDNSGASWHLRNGTIFDSDSDMNVLARESKFWYLWVVAILLSISVLIMIAAWLSAGPLSNRIPNTPIPWSSLVKTDGICELERKYLLRWSTSNYLE